MKIRILAAILAVCCQVIFTSCSKVDTPVTSQMLEKIRHANKQR